MPTKTYHVRRLTTDEYSTAATFELVLNQINASGGTITQIVSCSSIRPIPGFGYYWIDVIYTT